MLIHKKINHPDVADFLDFSKDKYPLSSKDNSVLEERTFKRLSSKNFNRSNNTVPNKSNDIKDSLLEKESSIFIEDDKNFSKLSFVAHINNFNLDESQKNNGLLYVIKVQVITVNSNGEETVENNFIQKSQADFIKLLESLITVNKDRKKDIAL